MTATILVFLLAVGCPPNWKKTPLPEMNTWLGFIVHPAGPIARMAPAKHDSRANLDLGGRR